MIRGKQGDKTINLILSLIVGFIVVIVVLAIFKGQSMSSSQVVSKYIESLSEDYDNDRINDFYDKSPCVAGEDLVIATTEKGRTEYFYADKPTQGCESIGVAEGYVLEEVTEEATGNKVCVLTDGSCAALLKEYYDCIRKDPSQC